MFSLLKNLKYLNWGLLIIILILISFGLIILYSLDLSHNNNLLFLKKQSLFAVIGVALFFIFSFIDHRFFKRYSYWIYLFVLLTLVAVLFFGQTIRGTRGWFVFGGIQFQPVELVKIALIIVLARFFSLRAYEIKRFQFIILSGLLLLPAFVLVMFQPDLGSAIILFIIWFGMLLVSGIKKKHFLYMTLILLVVFAMAWSFGFKEYQKARIMTFLNPSVDALGVGYNVIQSTIAIGSGGLFGRGILSGTQSQLHFLPEAHTDFIFSSIAEAFGFLGVGFVLFFYGLFFYKIIKAIKKIRDDFATFLVLGILIYLISQIFLNISMNLAIAPVMGLPLPLISYGGSSLVVTFMMLGMVSGALMRLHTDR